MKIFNNLGIRQKFQVVTAIIVLLISLFLFFYFPQKQKQEMMVSLIEKARVISQIIANNSSTAMLFDDASSVEKQLAVYKEMTDVEFVIVLKKDGTKFSSFNENNYGNYSKQIKELINSKTETYYDNKIAMGLYNVISNNQVIGNAVVAMNTKQLNSSASSARITALVISILIFILALVSMRIFFNKVIFKPISKLTHIADRIATGDIDVEINSKVDDEIGKLEKSFVMMIDSIKEQSLIAEMISNGDLSTYSKVKSNKDVLSSSMNKVIETLRNLLNEIKQLTESATEGKLSERGNISKYNGDYREIVKGVNATLDAVIEPINEGVSALKKIANGDLTISIDSSYKGDHQLIKNSINSLTDSLNKTMMNVNNAIEATASASTQISSSAEEMASGAQEQRTQTSDVARAVEEMTSIILHTTKSSNAAAEKSKKSGEIAEKGGKIVEETILGMNRIAEVVRHSASIVKELGKSSDQIGEIIQVIDDIADQTNLLALNAAIEAARAGEQGRGFAVVADEVRKLAERTTKATKEIASMIKQIQKDTGEAVKSMEDGTQEVENGITLSDEAGKSLKEIISGARETVDIVFQVASASEEQSSAAEQISKSIEGISSVTQESAAVTQQIARAAEDLNRLTNNLQDLISQFKIDKDHTLSSLGVRSNGKLVKSLGYQSD